MSDFPFDQHETSGADEWRVALREFATLALWISSLFGMLIVGYAVVG